MTTNRTRNSLRGLVAAAFMFAAQGSAQETVRLQGHVLDILTQAVHLSRNPQRAQEPLTLAVMLNWSDPAGFDAFRHEFENPASASYRKRLSAEEFKARFGPTQEAYDAVLAWLRQNGFSVVEGSANRLTITVSGTRGQAERAFGVTIDDYLMGKRQFHAIDTDPAIPSALAPVVRSVSGFSNLAQPHPSITPQVIAQAYNGALTPAGTLPGTGPNVLPPGINGAGQTVALLEFDSFNPSDVSFWLSQVGLPAGLINQVKTVPVNKGTAPSGCNITVLPCGEAEVLLDIGAVLGISPGANVAVLVTKQGATDNITMVNAAVNLLNQGPGGGGVISSSWGLCENEVSSSDDDSMEQLLQSAAVVGQTFFAATGDNASTCVDPQGTYPNTIQYPSNAPYAIAVGGTTLNPTASGSYGSESWWTGGGFGVSKHFGLPRWQSPFITASGRSVPDVSANAGSGILLCQNSQCTNGFNGTSLAAPTWASIWALASQAASLADGTQGAGGQGAYGGYYYSFAPYLHSPSNMTGPNNNFAHLGLGSPNITNVVSLVAGLPVVSGLSPTSGPDTGGTTVIIKGHAFIGVSSVLFSTVPAASFTVDSESQITAVSPSCLPSSGCQQASDTNSTLITIQTPAGSVSTNRFAYTASISKVSPNSGPMGGGTTVTVTGTGFSAGYNRPFYFDGIPAVNAQCSSTTQCTMGSPAHAPGTVDVTYAGSALVNTDTFTYTGPSITTVSPNVGAQIGGTTVSLMGTSLSETMTVKFGSTSVPVESCVGPTWCTVFTPAGTGAVNVTVTANGVTSAKSAADVFTYEAFPYGTMSPSSGSYLGGTVVTVTGANFSTVPGGTKFTFGSGSAAVAAKNVTCSSTKVCKMTTPAGSGQVAVSATANGLTLEIGEFTFTGGPTSQPPSGSGKQPPCHGICQ